MAATSRVVLFEPDLLFSSKVEGIASKLNIDLRVVTDLAELVRELDERTAKGFVISLDSLEGQLPVLAKYQNAMLNAVGYYSHVKTHLAEEARQRGLQTVLSRGAFAAKIQEILAEISTKRSVDSA